MNKKLLKSSKKLIAPLIAIAILSSCSDSTLIRPENAVIQGINYVGMTVSDLEQSADFYANAVELQLADSKVFTNNTVFETLAKRANVSIKTKLLKSANSQIRIMQFEQPSDAAKETKYVEVNGPGFAHVCYQTNSKTEAYQKFIAAGASTMGDPDMIQLSAQNPVKYAYARDLDHTMFEVEHVDVDKLNRKTPPKNDYRIRHVALATPDFKRIIKFYSTLLEQKKPRILGNYFNLSGEVFDRMSELEDVELKMAFFNVRNMELEIAEYVSHPTDTPKTPRPIDALGYNMIVFDVTDLTAAKEKLIAAGGTIETGTLALDGGEIFFGRDPDNNLLGFQRLNESSPYSAKNFKDDGSS